MPLHNNEAGRDLDCTESSSPFDSLKTLRRTLVALLLVIHTALLSWAAYRHSPTIDETVYLVAGIRNLQFKDFRLARVSPPLIRMVAAVPVVLADPATDWGRIDDSPGGRSEWEIAPSFWAANGDRTFWLFTLGRWACIPMSLLGASLCYHWAKKLYGPLSGLCAMALWCFCPNILAHAQLITPDVGGAVTGLLATYAFSCWLNKPTWRAAIWSGFALGLAQLARTTWLVLFPLWLLFWLFWRFRKADNRLPLRRALLRESSHVLTMYFLSVCLINMGYFFEGSCKRLDSYQFVSRTLNGLEHTKAKTRPIGNRFAGLWIGRIPVPLPENYVRGADVQKADFEQPQWSYLRGELKQGGWWYFYLYGLLVKMPLGTWLLFILATLLTATAVLRWLHDEAILLAPALVVIVTVSSQTAFSHHVRYVLPALPFLFIWSSKTAQLVTMPRSKTAAVAFAGLVWTICSSLAVYPHSHSYFNAIAGGPRGGHAHLIDSNIDWGQDLLFLHRWVQEHPEAQPLKLAYFGFVDPLLLDIQYTLPPRATQTRERRSGTSDVPHLAPGWYAVSVSFLRGRQLTASDGSGKRVDISLHDFHYFLRFRPVATAGYSIYIYHVGDDLQSSAGLSMDESE